MKLLTFPLASEEREQLLKEADETHARLTGALAPPESSSKDPPVGKGSAHLNSKEGNPPSNSSSDSEGEEDEQENMDCFTLVS